MKILVRRSNGFLRSGHVELFAWDDNQRDNEQIMTVKLDFYSKSPRPISNATINVNQELADTANTVLLESGVDFTEFTVALMQSSYREPNSYNSIKNNCVDAIIFALRQAGIEVPDASKSQVKHLIGCFWCPTQITTPKQLITYLQNHERITVTDPEQNVNENSQSSRQSINL